MRKSIIKKLMMGALTASLVMAPTLSAFAAPTTVSGNSEDVVAEVIAEAIVEETTVEEAKDEAPASSSETSVTVAEIPTTSSVAGTKTTVSGVYLATSVNGTAITTGMDAIKAGYGLAANEKAYAKFSNLDAKKSPLAKQAIDWAAASQNAVVGPMLNVELGKMTAGKYSLLPADGAAIRLSFGIPKNFAQDGKTYAVVCVRAGGAVSILADTDSNPNTVTFDTTGGAGAYAIIKY